MHADSSNRSYRGEFGDLVLHRKLAIATTKECSSSVGSNHRVHADDEPTIGRINVDLEYIWATHKFLQSLNVAKVRQIFSNSDLTMETCTNLVVFIRLFGVIDAFKSIIISLEPSFLRW
jgi:hypothetical protein